MRGVASFVVGVVLVLASAARCPAAYTFRDLHPAGHTNSFAVAIHDGQQVGYADHFDPRAFVWNGTAQSAVNLHPTQLSRWYSYGNAGWGGRQGGSMETVVAPDGVGRFVDHALLWSGTPGSAIDMHPGPQYSNSYIVGMNATRQVGSAYLGFDNAARRGAGYWTGTPGSFVDLHPADFDTSYATAISDTDDQIVGGGFTSRLPGAHPLLWTDGGVVDLRPPDFQYVDATGVSDRRQVGAGFGVAAGSKNHALLWEGSAEGYLDLHPAGFASSGANGISGLRVVGSATPAGTGALGHAMLWTLGADPLTGDTVVASLTDLHAVLPREYTGSSAMAGDRNGFIVGQAFHAPSGQWHAALWVPEPSADIALLAAAFGLAGRRRRRIGLA